MSKLSKAASSAALSAIGALASNGYLRIYSGEQPESADVPIGEAVLLAELRFQDVPFQDPVDGNMVANDLIKDEDAKAKGKPSWYRIYQADGETAVQDGTVGKNSGSDSNPTDMILNVSVIEKHSEVLVEGLVLAIV